ncbi:MAG: DUF5665 domain-containing protein [Fimbriimonadales bacterium]
MDDPGESLREEIARLRDEVARLEASIARLNRSLTSLKIRLAAGLVTGLGTVLGATLLVSLLIWLLRPLARLPVVDDVVRPAVESIERRAPAGSRPPQVPAGERRMTDRPEPARH